ncbi:MAG: GLUG motif-containing protein [Oscillospiraceae bacterium]
MIGNEEDLFRMAQDVDADEAYASAYYRLTADITLTRDFTPIGKVNPFTGTLDGKGFVIRDLNINSPTEKKVGLFAQLKGTVKDLGIESGMIAGKQYVGAIAGYAMEATVYNCYNKAAVTGGDAGGLIGQMNSSALYNSYNLGSVGAGTETSVGGLAGYAGSYNNHDVPTVIENCYSAGIVKAGEVGGAAVGYNDDLYPTEMKSVFYDSTLTTIGIGNNIGASSVQGKSTEEMQSFAVAAALNLGKTGAAWNSWIRGDSGYPEFGTDDSTAELQDFLNLHLNVSPAVDENGYLVMPESTDGLRWSYSDRTTSRL